MSCKRAIWTGMALVVAIGTMGARYETPNFIVEAPTDAIARQVGLAAEAYRKQLAIQWLGRPMPRWYRPCLVRVKVGPIGAGGATTFAFDRGRTGRMEVFGWRMTIQGPLDRILDSVLPHEISHTILACHFRRPLPRWADEGAATLAEDESEKQRQQRRALQALRSSRRIPLHTLLSLTEYPSNMENVLTLYAEGYMLAEYLVQKGGRTRYLAFLEDGHRRGWDDAIRRHYGLGGVSELESRWSRWVLAGAPGLQIQIAATSRNRRRAGATEPVVRSQTPDAPKSSPKWRIRPAVALGRSLAQRSSPNDSVRPAGPVGSSAATTGGLSLATRDFRSDSLSASSGWAPTARRWPARPARSSRSTLKRNRRTQPLVRQRF